MAYTEGPWKIFATYNIQTEAGRTVANCNTRSSNGPDREQIQDENQANARLIAVAPQMLAELRETRVLLETLLHFAVFLYSDRQAVIKRLARLEAVIAEAAMPGTQAGEAVGEGQ